MSSRPAASTKVWRETRDAGDAVGRTLAGLDALERPVRAMLGSAQTRRVLVSANGASLHAALSLWHSAVSSGSSRAVQWVPAGHVLTGAVRLEPDDVLVVVSVSGELRDLIDAVRHRPRSTRVIAVSADPRSTLAELADVVVPLDVASQLAVTHTQAYLGATAACSWMAGVAFSDDGLDSDLQLAPTIVQRSVVDAERLFAPGAVPDAVSTCRSAVVHGAGAAWPAAMQGALMLKEIAGLPAEGVESREAATSSFSAMGPEQLLLAVRDDDLNDDIAGAARYVGAVTMSASQPDVPERLVQLATFAGPLAIALVLAERRGLDADRPWWYGHYLSTARVNVVA